ncbi:MAG: hypothetical protein WKI04_06590 [Ferruginibacter sp.]
MWHLPVRMGTALDDELKNEMLGRNYHNFISLLLINLCLQAILSGIILKKNIKENVTYLLYLARVYKI